jgi:hypothetical protein
MAARLILALGPVLAATLAAAPLPAAAETITSAYTKLDLAACAAIPPHPDDPLESGAWECDGYAGVPVYVSEGDLRFFVSFGPNAKDEPAAGETLPQFNNIGPTLEWRIAGGRPFATILRFFVDPGDGSARTQVLVVTRLGPPGSVCRVGWVDASLNPDANFVAREVADNAARRFECGVETALQYGLTGDDAQE